MQINKFKSRCHPFLPSPQPKSNDNQQNTHTKHPTSREHRAVFWDWVMTRGGGDKRRQILKSKMSMQYTEYHVVKEVNTHKGHWNQTIDKTTIPVRCKSIISNRDDTPFTQAQVKHQSTKYTYKTPNQPRIQSSVFGLGDYQRWGKIRGDKF